MERRSRRVAPYVASGSLVEAFSKRQLFESMREIWVGRLKPGDPYRSTKRVRADNQSWQYQVNPGFEEVRVVGNAVVEVLGPWVWQAELDGPYLMPKKGRLYILVQPNGLGVRMAGIGVMSKSEREIYAWQMEFTEEGAMAAVTSSLGGAVNKAEVLKGVNDLVANVIPEVGIDKNFLPGGWEAVGLYALRSGEREAELIKEWV